MFKEESIQIIKDGLSQFSEVEKIILFGSFLRKDQPNDIDIAVVQNSNDDYLTLSMRYRKALRKLSKIIALDIIPLRHNGKSAFMEEIAKGITVYER
jgi:predicted nucleotidyltransferase